MQGTPSCWIVGEPHDQNTFELDGFLMLNSYLDSWITDMRLNYRVKCAAIAFSSHEGGFFVRTKVMLRPTVRDGDGTSFMHEEPWSEFPSDHFKTKILLATGGA